LEPHALLQRAQAGDPDAVGALYREHAPAIYRYFWMRISDPAQAEDLTSEVFLRMVEALPRYEARGVPFSAWLYRMAHDRYVDYVRYSVRRPSQPLEDDLVSPAASLETQVADALKVEQLRQMLFSLTDEQRSVVQLRFIENLSLAETAQRLGKTIGAVKAMQHRALQSLAQNLDQHLDQHLNQHLAQDLDQHFGPHRPSK
jgi:RNA polymerase sigma-70 factor (ECF subfamily)